MPRQGTLIGSEAFRQPERLPLIGYKVNSPLGLRHTIFEILAQDKPQILVEGHQKTIEGGIVQGVQTQAVRWIQAPGLMAGPRQDMAGPQQGRMIEPGKRTGPPVRTQHRFPEEVLTTARLDRSRDGGVAGNPDGKPVQMLCGFFDRRAPVLLEDRPHLAIQPACPFQTTPPAFADRRIEACEVAELHRHARRTAIQRQGKLPDLGRVLG